MTSASSLDNQLNAPATPPEATAEEPAKAGSAAAHRQALASLPFRQLPTDPADWLLHGEAPREGQPLVLMHQTAVLQVAAHSRSNLDCELGGALLGHAYRYKSGVVVEVKAALPAISGDHGPVHFTFSADSWSRLHRDRAAHYANLDIVGWFHTHPDLGVFYSSDDVVVHSAAFTQPWHVGLVVDPIRDEAAYFGWQTGELAPLDGFYELPERQPETQVPWRSVRASVWSGPYVPDDAGYGEAGSRVVLARNARPRFSGRELGMAASAAALLLSFFLIFGVVGLRNKVRILETTVLNLAQVTLADTCPDPRLRILTPLHGQAYPAGATIQFIGTAEFPGARRYQIEARPAGNNPWSPVDRLNRDTRLGLLGEWPTEGLAAGDYEVRLSPVDNNNIRLTDSSPCSVSVFLVADAGG